MAEIAPFLGVLHQSKDAERRVTTPTSAADYQKALADGVWAPDSVPVIYRCHQEFEVHGKAFLRKSFIALTRLSPFADGVVLPCRVPVVAKPDELMRARVHATPPLGLHVDRYHMVDGIFAELETFPPDAQGCTDGVVHRVWRLTDEKAQQRICHNLAHDKIYLADGQDRWEAMLALRDELGPGQPGHDFAPMQFCNVDDEGLVVLATHRVVSGVPGFERGDVLSRAREFFTVSEGPLAGPQAVRPALHGQRKRGATLAMITPDSSKIAYLRLRGDLIKSSVPALAESRALGDLDITLLHGVVLETLLGIERGSAQIRYVADWERAFAELETPGVQAVFLVNPTLVEQLCAVADEGHVLPPHAASFYPPLPPGLVMHAISADEKVHVPG